MRERERESAEGATSFARREKCTHRVQVVVLDRAHERIAAHRPQRSSCRRTNIRQREQSVKRARMGVEAAAFSERRDAVCVQERRQSGDSGIRQEFLQHVSWLRLRGKRQARLRETVKRCL